MDSTQKAKLRANDFWKRKFQRALQVRDLDKDGWITRNDFKLVIQRYKELGASQEHLDKLSSLLLGSLDKMGLTDDSKKFSYQEFEEMWAKIPITDAAGMQMFRIIDSNNDGKISFKEWQDHRPEVRDGLFRHNRH